MYANKIDTPVFQIFEDVELTEASPEYTKFGLYTY